MASSNQLGVDTELRKLKAISPSHALKLVQILDENDSWKFLMSTVPKVLPAEYSCEASVEEKKYNADHVRLIENAAKKDSRTASEIFLLEWSTSGRRRVTLGHILVFLQKAQLYRAADYVAVKILNIEAPSRPTTGPAAKIDVLQLDAELSDDDEDAPSSTKMCNGGGNVNEHPQVSNLTIENNLDNSKPQNSHRDANIGKLLIASTPLVQICEATASLNIEQNSINGIVLQSLENSQNYHVTRPELSRLLEVTSKEINLRSDNNSSSVYSSDSTSASNSDENPLISLINQPSSNDSNANHVPCLSELLGNDSQEHNTSLSNSSAQIPNLSGLLQPKKPST